MPHAQTWEGTVCSQLIEAHASTDGDTVSYTFRKGNTPVLNTPKERHVQGLFDVLRADGVSQADMVVSEQFFAALHGQPSSSSMTQTRYKM